MARHRVSGAYTMRVESRKSPSWKGVISGEAACAGCSRHEPWRCRHGPPACSGAAAFSHASGIAPARPTRRPFLQPSASVRGLVGGRGGGGSGRGMAAELDRGWERRRASARSELGSEPAPRQLPKYCGAAPRKLPKYCGAAPRKLPKYCGAAPPDPPPALAHA